MEVPSSLITWSWIFLFVYMVGMIGLGYWGSRKVQHADDFATARGSYGPYFLAFAFAATTASGATFLGGPGLAYEIGLSTTWGNFLYPMGVYLGILISMRLVAKAGNNFGNRSIPEYLGDRFQSDGLRVLVSLLSLVLLFYITGQLVAGLVMFETMLGLTPFWALTITTAVLLVYVVLGGAHADILTDGIQGIMMLILAIVVIVIFLFGVGLEGNLFAVLDNIGEQDEHLATVLNETHPLTHSPWSIICVFFAHIPLGLLPHLGNKLWALRSPNDQQSFVTVAFLCGITLGMMGLGGLVARALLGDGLLADGMNPNASLPFLFIELFPVWLAALIGVGVLAAIMSTADGLVVSSSQVIANDLYRRSIVPWRKLDKKYSDEQLDSQVLTISRVATVIVLVLCAVMAWLLQDRNIALIVLIGAGGMMAAFAGPLVVGALWRGMTKAGAYAGLISGFVVFVVLHAQLIDPSWFGDGGVLFTVATWLYGEGPNPFSCAALGEFVGVTLTVVVSKLTAPLDEEHLAAVFGDAPAATAES